jgi:hypothetical protein
MDIPDESFPRYRIDPDARRIQAEFSQPNRSPMLHQIIEAGPGGVFTSKIIADEMGTGKTLTAIIWFRRYYKHRTAELGREHEAGQSVDSKTPRLLVVCPMGVMPVWEQEIKLWWPGHPLLTVLHHSHDRKPTPPYTDLVSQAMASTIVIISYETMTAKHKNPTANEYRPMIDLFVGTETLERKSVLIIDEAHRIRNAVADVRSGKQSGSIMWLTRAFSLKILLTGTPVNNHFTDLCALTMAVGVGPLSDAGNWPVVLPTDPRELRCLTNEINLVMIRRAKTMLPGISTPPRFAQIVHIPMTRAQDQALCRLFRHCAPRFVGDPQSASVHLPSQRMPWLQFSTNALSIVLIGLLDLECALDHLVPSSLALPLTRQAAHSLSTETSRRSLAIVSGTPSPHSMGGLGRWGATGEVDTVDGLRQQREEDEDEADGGPSTQEDGQVSSPCETDRTPRDSVVWDRIVAEAAAPRMADIHTTGIVRYAHRCDLDRRVQPCKVLSYKRAGLFYSFHAPSLQTLLETSSFMRWMVHTCPTFTARGEKILIFSDRLAALSLYRDGLQELYDRRYVSARESGSLGPEARPPVVSLYDGGDSPSARQDMMDHFTLAPANEVPIMCLTSAANEGLPIVCANVFINADPPYYHCWREQQACERTHRPPQFKPVRIIHVLGARLPVSLMKLRQMGKHDMASLVVPNTAPTYSFPAHLAELDPGRIEASRRLVVSMYNDAVAMTAPLCWPANSPSSGTSYEDCLSRTDLVSVIGSSASGREGVAFALSLWLLAQGPHTEPTDGAGPLDVSWMGTVLPPFPVDVQAGGDWWIKDGLHSTAAYPVGMGFKLALTEDEVSETDSTVPPVRIAQVEHLSTNDEPTCLRRSRPVKKRRRSRAEEETPSSLSLRRRELQEILLSIILAHRRALSLHHRQPVAETSCTPSLARDRDASYHWLVSGVKKVVHPPSLILKTAIGREVVGCLERDIGSRFVESPGLDRSIKPESLMALVGKLSKVKIAQRLRLEQV